MDLAKYIAIYSQKTNIDKNCLVLFDIYSQNEGRRISGFVPAQLGICQTAR